MRQEMIRLENVSFAYEGYEEQAAPKEVLHEVSFSVQKGEFVCLLGHNGSGKSTLAKLMNGLLVPTAGKVLIKGLDTAEEDNLLAVRACAGMVFQNPDNQTVATVVEDDVAFGPENLGVPAEEIRARGDRARSDVQMLPFAKNAVHALSGGQKQRVAIAGMLAMQPEIMIFDEPTAMLDPVGRREVMKSILALNREKGITVLHITHFMEEAALADRILVVSDGRVVMEGTPREIFVRLEQLRSLALDVPEMTHLADLLRRGGVDVPADILTVKEMADALCPLN